MNKVNTIFDYLSYSNIISTVDIYTAPLGVSGISSNYSECEEPGVIYANNTNYSTSDYDQGFSTDLSLNTLSSAIVDGNTSAKLTEQNTINDLNVGADKNNSVRAINATVFGKHRDKSYEKDYRNDSSTVDGNHNSLTVTADVIGIGNSSKLNTGKRNHDNVTLVGLASSEALGSLEIEAIADEADFAQANSESSVVLDVLAIGLDNSSKILTGKGDDLVAGIADTSTSSNATATSMANAFLNEDLIADGFNNVTAEANSSAFANSVVSTFGIFNSDTIYTRHGNDVVLGLASSESSSNANSSAEANAYGNDSVFANVNAFSTAVTQNATVGIINTGKIVTGRGSDAVIGLAFNQSTADAVATANAVANNGTVTDTNSNTNAIADTTEVVEIGIDNSDGSIRTGKGSDQVIGFGHTIGISGGEIKTGGGRDRIIGYGEGKGIEATTIYTGSGDDYVQAAIRELDPLTGQLHLAGDQTGSISNAQIFGQSGNDTFEIGDFEGNVLVDGGKHHDTLKLMGDVDSYQFTFGNSDNNDLTIDNNGSILTVKNVESFYLGGSEQHHLHSISDFV